MFYEFMRGIGKLLFKVPHRVKYEGLENVPATGPVLLIGNHQHYGDPVLMAMVTDRPVCFLGKEELFKGKLRSWFFRKLKVIALDRDGVDRKAIKEAIQVLKDGGVLGVFPEGTRSPDSNMLPFKSGICFIASQAPCQIVPMGITFEDNLFNYLGKPVKVKVGKSFPYEAIEGEKRKETQQRMSEKQEKAVYQLISRKE